MFFNSRVFTISAIYVKAQFKRSFKPKITISGDWLKEAGFNIGEKIEVQIFENKLIIKPLENGSHANK